MANNNPFSDLVPQQQAAQQQSNTDSGNNNPFSDLIPAGKNYWDEDHGAFMNGIKAFSDHVEAAATGFNRQIERLTTGAMQKGAQALGAVGIDTQGFQDKLAAYNAQQEQDNNLEAEKYPISQGIGAVAGALGKGILVGAPSAGASLGAQVAGYAGRGALEGASEYGDSKDSLINGAIAGGVAGAVPLIGAGIGAGLQKGAQALFKSPEQVQEAANMINGGQYITAGQATGNPIVQGVEKQLENIPIVGTGKGIQKATDSLATKVQQELSSVGADKTIPNNSLSDSILRAYKNATDATNEAYSTANKLAEQSNAGDIPLNNSQAYMKNEIGKIQDLSKSSGFTFTDSTNSKLQKLVEDFSSSEDKSVSPTSFETLRKSVGGVLDDLYKGNSDSNMIPIISQLKSKLDDDLTSYGDKTGGQISDAYNNARKVYTEQKAPFTDPENPLIKHALKGGDSDQLFNSLTQNNKPERVKFLMDHLSEDDKTNFTAALFGKAVQGATNNEGDVVLPKLATSLHKMGKTIDVLPDHEQSVARGLTKLISANEGMLTKSTTTANAVKGIAIGGAAMTALPVKIALAAFTKGVSSLLTNPVAVRGLVKLAGGDISKTMEHGLIHNLITLAGEATPVAAGVGADQVMNSARDKVSDNTAPVPKSNIPNDNTVAIGIQG